MRRPIALEGLLMLLAVAAALYGFGARFRQASAEPGPRRPGTFRVVTWNLGTPDGPLHANSTSPAALLEQVRRTLIEIDADVMVLQEVEADTSAFLAASFGESSQDRAFRAGPGGRGPGCAILARHGRIAERSSGDGGRHRSVRVTYRPETGRAIDVLGLHADAWSSGERNRQIGRAVDSLSLPDAEALSVLAGDLNLDVDLGGGKDLFTEDEYLDVQTYNYLAERMRDAGAGTGPTAEPDRRLDYIFLGGPGFDLSSISAAVWRGRRAGAMDHDPLVVDVPRP